MHCIVQLGNGQKKMHRTNLNPILEYFIQNDLENVETIKIFHVSIPDLSLNTIKAGKRALNNELGASCFKHDC